MERRKGRICFGDKSFVYVLFYAMLARDAIASFLCPPPIHTKTAGKDSDPPLGLRQPLSLVRDLGERTVICSSKLW